MSSDMKRVRSTAEGRSKVAWLASLGLLRGRSEFLPWLSPMFTSRENHVSRGKLERSKIANNGPPQHFLRYKCSSELWIPNPILGSSYMMLVRNSRDMPFIMHRWSSFRAAVLIGSIHYVILRLNMRPIYMEVRTNYVSDPTLRRVDWPKPAPKR